jgi:hypothetical protein
MFGRGNRDRSQSRDSQGVIETVESTSIRVKDGILINELEQLEVTGGH